MPLPSFAPLWALGPDPEHQLLPQALMAINVKATHSSRQPNFLENKPDVLLMLSHLKTGHSVTSVTLQTDVSKTERNNLSKASEGLKSKPT